MGDETGEVPPPRPDGLLLKLRGSQATGFSAEAGALMARGEPLLTLAPADDGFGMAATPATWVRLPASDNPWDEVHALARRGFGVDGAELLAAEPDWQQGFAFEAAAAPGDRTAAKPKTGGGLPPTPAGHWHLEDGFSQLKRAAAEVRPEKQARIRIAHLDTGYDPQHRAKPANLETALARSFVAGDPDPHSAVDRTGGGIPGVGAARGHGTGTLGLLAAPGIGGAPGARVLPIRVANGVVIFSTASIAKGFDWALANRADVLSMSMGGLASKLFADAVNACYAAGMVMVTAAGNNFGGLPIPTIVYPARFRRVVAAVGAMADGRPYADLPLRTMAGCYGPKSKMATAVAGFTPNVPWPRIGCPDTIDRDGAGTSSATPQVAAAVALWLAKYGEKLAALPQAWMRGEAARRALFASASRGAAGQPPDLRLGQGLLRAFDLLAVEPLPAAALKPEARADAGWDLLKLLSGHGLGVGGGRMPGDEMLELELVQLAQRDPALAGLLEDPEAGASEAEARRFLEAAAEHPEASRSLAFALKRALAGDGPGAAPAPRVPPAPPAGPVPAPVAAASATAGSPVPARRRLAIYARDPTLGASLDSFEASVATVEVRHEPDLMPGPVGDYVEVVDIDPASDRVYPPVDLNDLNLALSDGFRPSEGNPGFHQQMVYAVIMRVVDAFEQALGRRLLWGGTSRFVRRLRVYPHALRQANAYYSPDKVALLFGYFPARSRLGDRTPEGTMVFTCLSADIIAHETTHAVLDGQAPPFRDPSNPDVLAFHEGFADIVALFQQFSIPDLVRREVARARGDLKGARLLGSLAAQFGEGLGKSGPLRQYLSLPEEVAYGRTTAVHALGSILVAAVYHAFLAIVDRRSARLVRLATGGSGRLPDGHLHPDLVDALTAEVVRGAADVQKMCIRALDYLPPVDLTFGDYLRAIITADVDSWPMDESGYRVAFLEAFRAFGLLPRTLRTVSVETLVWAPPAERAPAGLAALVEALDFRPGPVRSRAEIHELAQMRQAAVAEHLGRMLAVDPGLHALLGLEPGLGRFDRNGQPMAADGGTGGSGTNFYVDAVRIKRRELAERTGPPREAFDVIVRVRQRRPELLDPANPALGRFWFRGGATLIIDPFCEDGTPRIRHAIRRPMTDRDRLGRERAWRQQRSATDLRAAYFGAEDDPGQPLDGAEPFRLLHAHREED